MKKAAAVRIATYSQGDVFAYIMLAPRSEANLGCL